VWVDFEELNARGWAEVIEEHPCPKIAEGPGRVVTATITHGENSQPFAETVWVLADVSITHAPALSAFCNHRRLC
jgi:hypothetical protein